MPRIVRVQGSLPAGHEALLAESVGEGFRFVHRLLDEWSDGRNRFGLPGEGLWLALSRAGWQGVCGLNLDPYAADGQMGRVRHLYVRPSWRRRGLGAELLAAVQAAAAPHFSCLRLRTDSPTAARWYEARGFSPLPGEPDASHRRELR